MRISYVQVGERSMLAKDLPSPWLVTSLNWVLMDGERTTFEFQVAYLANTGHPLPSWVHKSIHSDGQVGFPGPPV